MPSYPLFFSVFPDICDNGQAEKLHLGSYSSFIQLPPSPLSIRCPISSALYFFLDAVPHVFGETHCFSSIPASMCFPTRVLRFCFSFSSSQPSYIVKTFISCFFVFLCFLSCMFSHTPSISSNSTGICPFPFRLIRIPSVLPHVFLPHLSVLQDCCITFHTPACAYALTAGTRLLFPQLTR